MNLYIDKENLLSIIKQSRHPLYGDAIKMMKKQLSLFFNFPKKSIKGDELIMALFQLLTDGVGDAKNMTFLDDEFIVPERPIKQDCMSTFSDNKFSAIYLINDIDLKTLKGHGAVLVGAPGEEMSIFDKLFLQNKDYDFHKDIKIGGPDFKKWADLSKFNLPLTDVVFVDRYILADISLIEGNFIEYLKVLCQYSRSKVNVVLYVDKSQVGIQYQDLESLIKKEVFAITGVIPSVTLVVYSEQAGQDTLGEHDRTIFTNYIRIKSGDSYNYFLTNGKVKTKGREISYNSLAKKDSHELAKTLISDLQKNIDFLKANNTGIQGDRSSNYLNFK